MRVRPKAAAGSANSAEFAAWQEASTGWAGRNGVFTSTRLSRRASTLNAERLHSSNPRPVAPQELAQSMANTRNRRDETGTAQCA